MIFEIDGTLLSETWGVSNLNWWYGHVNGDVSRRRFGVESSRLVERFRIVRF